MTARYYVSADASQGERDKLRKWYRCAECGAWLSMWLDKEGQIYLACHEHQRNQHEGIAKPYFTTEHKIGNQTVDFRGGKEMVTGTALEKYQGVTSLTKQDASEIIDTIWPEARAVSPAEVYKAVTIATQYGLNPLMRHLYLIPFKTKVGDNRWETRYVTVLGIGANRLIASRKHSYSYIDDSPRLMSDEEQMKIFGEIDAKNLRAITILKDMKTGASARGYGSWPRDTEPKGTDKGNSKANMAFIRSERQALDRLYPADMPHDVEVVDERYEVTATVEPPTIPPPGDAPADEATPADQAPTAESLQRIQDATGEALKGLAGKTLTSTSQQGKAQPTTEAGIGQSTAQDRDNLKRKEPPQSTVQAESRPPAQEATKETKPLIDVAWFQEGQKLLCDRGLTNWSNKNTLAYLKKRYHVAGDQLSVALSNLNQEQARELVAEMMAAIDKTQPY